MRMRFNNAGFTLIEMVVVIVLTAILAAMAAPLVVHLVDSYIVSQQGEDLATAVGPAVAEMQWDARSAGSLTLATTGCGIVMAPPTGQTVPPVVTYTYTNNQILWNNGSNNVPILSDVQPLSGGCPFTAVTTPTDLTNFAVQYAFVYTGPGLSGRFPVQGTLLAYGCSLTEACS